MTRTLGDLLYAHKPKDALSEAEWVQLVRAVAAGDQLALHALYERTHRLVFTLALRITKDRETAEEVTLDVFHEVWRRAPRYDAENGTVVGWIMNRARSRAIDRLRFEQRKKRAVPDTETIPIGPAAMDVDEALDLRSQGVRMRNALAFLTPDERQVIEIAYFGDLTHSEVAALLNQPLGTVKTRIRSGLAKLKQALTDMVEP
jgi:RNA polymerase sigma-70 factor (ECF subfamily)